MSETRSRQNRSPEKKGFYGETVQSLSVDELTLRELHYPPRAQIPHHSHTRPMFNFILAGSYTEFWDKSRMTCCPPAVLFHPAGLTHSERFSESGARCLVVEFDTNLMDGFKINEAMDQTETLPAPQWSWIAGRLRDELHRGDDLSHLVLHGILQMLLAGTVRWDRNRSGQRPPRFVERAGELIHERFREPLNMAQIARTVGTHPSHLARAFRHHHKCTLGEYARRLRVEFCCRRISDPERSLAQIAAEAGFADQSHMTRTFRRLTGMTPGKFRRATALN